MTGMQARKVATAFANCMSFVREDAARAALVDQFVRGMSVYEHDVPWGKFIADAMTGCMEQRQKEQRELRAAQEVATAQKAEG